jgi:hypothetical protein
MSKQLTQTQLNVILHFLKFGVLYHDEHQLEPIPTIIYNKALEDLEDAVKALETLVS